MNGPAKKICHPNAIGKFMTVVCSHTAMKCIPAFLNKNVAIKLIIGHMRQTINEQSIIVIWNE